MVLKKIINYFSIERARIKKLEKLQIENAEEILKINLENQNLKKEVRFLMDENQKLKEKFLNFDDKFE